MTMLFVDTKSKTCCRNESFADIRQTSLQHIWIESWHLGKCLNGCQRRTNAINKQADTNGSYGFTCHRLLTQQKKNKGSRSLGLYIFLQRKSKQLFG